VDGNIIATKKAKVKQLQCNSWYFWWTQRQRLQTESRRQRQLSSDYEVFMNWETSVQLIQSQADRQTYTHRDRNNHRDSWPRLSCGAQANEHFHRQRDRHTDRHHTHGERQTDRQTSSSSSSNEIFRVA